MWSHLPSRVVRDAAPHQPPLMNTSLATISSLAQSTVYPDLDTSGDERLLVSQGDDASLDHIHRQRVSLTPEYRITVSCLVIAIITFTTFGNLLTIIAVRLDKKLRSPSNLYIASLAFADLMVGSFVMTFMLLYTITFDGAWIFGDLFCDVWTFVDYVSCTASLTNVCLIAYDRYQTVASPFKAIRRRTKKRALCLIGVAWLVPAVFWLILIVVLRKLNGRSPTTTCHLIWKPKFIVLLSASTIVYLPIGAILAFFVAMMWVLRYHMTNMNHRMQYSASLRRRSYDCNAQYEEDRTSLRAGGISFNPRVTAEISLGGVERDRVRRIRRYSTQDSKYNLDVSLTSLATSKSTTTTVTSSSRSSSVAADDEFFIYKNNDRRYRSIGTNTSPERFGLVRSIGVNTSPLRDLVMADSLMPEVMANRGIINSLPAQCRHIKKMDSTDTDYSSTTESASDIRSITESDTDTAGDRSSSSHSPSRDSRFSCDSSTPRKWRRYASLLREERQTSLERSRLKQQLRAAKTLGLIMAFLLLCWLPFSVMWPLSIFYPNYISQRTYDISFWTNYLNSSINPIIYCLCNVNYRRAFQRLLGRRL